MRTSRQDAYRSLLEPLSQVDVARELGVTTDFVAAEIGAGRLLAGPDGTISGTSLARYLDATHRAAVIPGRPVKPGRF